MRKANPASTPSKLSKRATKLPGSQGKAGWPTKQTEVSYRMKLVGRRAGMESVEALDINFLTVYEFASDSMVSSLGEDDYITADPNAPVFTKEQLERIASVNNYKR